MKTDEDRLYFVKFAEGMAEEQAKGPPTEPPLPQKRPLLKLGRR